MADAYLVAHFIKSASGMAVKLKITSADSRELLVRRGEVWGTLVESKGEDFQQAKKNLLADLDFRGLGWLKPHIED
jgi:hypothetical protein